MNPLRRIGREAGDELDLFCERLPHHESCGGIRDLLSHGCAHLAGRFHPRGAFPRSDFRDHTLADGRRPWLDQASVGGQGLLDGGRLPDRIEGKA